MAAELGIAVGTLRKALAELERQRAAGAGARLRQLHPRHQRCPKASMPCSGWNCWRAAACPRPRCSRSIALPKAAGLPRFRHRRPRPTASAACAASPASRRRWRRSGSTPAMPKTLTAEDLSESLYLLLPQTLGLWITRAEDQRRAWAACPTGRRRFSAGPPARPCRWSRASAGRRTAQRAEVSRTWFDPGRSPAMSHA